MGLYILATSILLQLAAVVVVGMITWITVRRSWILIASAILLMAIRRSISFYQVIAFEKIVDPIAESVALLISLLMLVGFMTLLLRERSITTPSRTPFRSTAKISSPGTTAAILGILIVIAISVVSYMSFVLSRNALVDNVFATNLSFAHSLSTLADSQKISLSSADRIDIIDDVWEANKIRYEGSYVCITNAKGDLLLHTKLPSTQGQYVGDRVIQDEDQRFHTLIDVIKAKSDWAGWYSSGTGERQLASFVYNPTMSSLIGVHVPRKAIEQEILRGILPLGAGLIIIVLLLLPAALGVLYRAYSATLQDVKSSEARYRAVVEDQTDLICRNLPDSTITFVNAAYCRCFGKNLDELVGHKFMPIVHEQDQPMVQEFFASMGKENAVAIHEHRVIDCDGETRWQRWTNRAILDESGEVIEFQGTGRDITQRKLAQQALLESEDKFRTIFQSAPDAVFLISIEGKEAGRIVAANDTAHRMHGYQPSELVGKLIADIDSDESSHTVPERLHQLAAGEQLHFEIDHQHKDGTVFPVEVTAQRIILDGRVHILAFDRDITERKQAEAQRLELETQLRQSQKMEAIGQLAGGVAHDFNNLLQVILGCGEMAQNADKKDKPVGEFLEPMMKAGDRAKSLVSQLLAFSRRQVLQVQDLDLNDIITDILKMIRRLIGEHVTLDFVPSDNLGTVRADRGQIEQILTNLCVNARDAMPEGGTITIKIENILIDDAFCASRAWGTSGPYAMLSITDTGCGMDDKTLGQIFEPFFTTKEVGKGTGLGLATAYGLIMQHDGQVEVESKVGVGTTFKVYLPLIERESAIVGEKTESTITGGTETILLAEDDDMVMALCKTTLEDAGYTVLLARDGQEAVHVFNDHYQVLDLVLLDVVMPKLGGRAVFGKIREKCPDMRVIFSSGYNTDNAIHNNFILDEGLTLIQKPYRSTDLLQLVRATLDQA